jgi:hypothetical protein
MKIERKIMDVLTVYQFSFRRGKGTRDAIGMLRIMLQRTWKTDEELGASFIDCQKDFDHVNWAQLIQILTETGIKW